MSGPRQPQPEEAPAGAWESALGHSDVPIVLPDAEIPDSMPRQPHRRRRRRRMRALRVALVLLLVAALAVGGYVALSDSGSKVPNAGGLPGVTATNTPSSTASGSASASPSPSKTSTAPSDPALNALQLQISDALTATSWPTLDPSLSSLSKAGVTDASKIKCTAVTSKNVTKCVLGASKPIHHAVLVGDEAAISWLPALLGSLGQHGWSIQLLTMSHCPVATVTVTQGSKNKADPDCTAHHAFVASEIAKLKPDIVFMSDSPADLAHVGTKTDAPGKITAGLKAALTEYKKYAKKLVVIGAPPGGKSLTKCVTATSKPSDCNEKVPPAATHLEQAEKAAAKGLADYIDATPYFCTSNGCPAVVGNTPVYTDGSDVTELYAQKLAFAFGKYAVRTSK